MNLSIEEVSGEYINIYKKLYEEINPSNNAVVNAQDAASFLKRSNLDTNILGHIWEIADFNKRACLDQLGVFIAFKLVAACQQGHQPSLSSLSMYLNPPSFASRSATPSIPMLTNLQTSNKWVINSSDRAKYESVFIRLNPVDGKVPGDKDGQLDSDEMCIALHLVFCALQGEEVPSVLPSSLSKLAKNQYRKFSLENPPGSQNQRSLRRPRTASVASIEMPGQPPMNVIDSTRSISVQPSAMISSSIIRTPSISDNSWPIQSAFYESRFNEIDSNQDGLVSGADLRDELFKSGISQTVLAHLWALVDLRKSGTLNLEQYALIMYLIDECKNGKSAPASLPPSLIPPSFRSARPLSSSRADGLSGNKELGELRTAIQNLIVERRESDQAVVQLEADMTVKNSEMRNLQIELNTLRSTVVQLEKQKGEAEKRLEALDRQILQLEPLEQILKEKLKEEECRLEDLRSENINNRENSAREIEELNRIKKAVEQLEEEKTRLGGALAQRNAIIERGALQLTKLESDVVNLEEEIRKINQGNENMKECHRFLSGCIEKSDVDSLLKNKDRLISQKFAIKFLECENNCAPSQRTAVDPFGHDVLANADPFSGDPFQSSSAFMNSSQQFISRENSSGVSAKSPPPRPAPPKRQTPIESDPFESAESFSSLPVDQFADFASFDAFISS